MPLIEANDPALVCLVTALVTSRRLDNDDYAVYQDLGERGGVKSFRFYGFSRWNQARAL